MTDDAFLKNVLSLFYDYDVRSDLLWWKDSNGDIKVGVDCSDMFAWGTSDFEDITPDNFHLLVTSFEDAVDPTMGRQLWGSLLFASRVRRMSPMKAFMDVIKDERLKKLLTEHDEVNCVDAK